MERVRGIIYGKEKKTLILIKKVKEDHTYYVFPGGVVQDSLMHLGHKYEINLEKQLKKVVFEEVGISIDILKKFMVEDYNGVRTTFYLANYEAGKMESKLGNEANSQNMAVEIEINDLASINLVPENIKQELLKLHQ